MQDGFHAGPLYFRVKEVFALSPGNNYGYKLQGLTEPLDLRRMETEVDRDFVLLQCEEISSSFFDWWEKEKDKYQHIPGAFQQAIKELVVKGWLGAKGIRIVGEAE